MSKYMTEQEVERKLTRRLNEALTNKIDSFATSIGLTYLHYTGSSVGRINRTFIPSTCDCEKKLEALLDHLGLEMVNADYVVRAKQDKKDD